MVDIRKWKRHGTERKKMRDNDAEIAQDNPAKWLPLAFGV